jgi:hypothetical protein
MSRLPRRGELIGAAVLIAVIVVALYFGWISEAPPLLAPGIK